METAERQFSVGSEFNKVACWLICTFLAYASWYGPGSIGNRSIADFIPESLPIHGATLPGMINALAILLISTTLLVLMIPTLKSKPLGRVELLVAAFLLINLLNFPIPLQKEYFIGLENAFFLCVLTLSLSRLKYFSDSLSSFRKGAPWAEGGAYLLALIIPLILQTSIPNVEIWKPQGVVLRYSGWLGLATYIGFLGLSVAIMGAMTAYYRERTRGNLILGIALIALGFVGIHLAVHRIALWAASVFFLYAFFLARKQKDTFFRRFFLLAFIFCIGTQFTGKMLEKNMFFSRDIKGIRVLDARELWVTIRAVNFDDFIQTNGRVLAAKLIIRKVNEGGASRSTSSMATGLGTGSTAYMVENESSVQTLGGQPHNDYLRVYGDHGMLGICLMLFIGIFLFLEVRGTLAAGVLMAFAVSMLTDNLMVLPIWGYGPMLLAGLLVQSRKIKQPITNAI